MLHMLKCTLAVVCFQDWKALYATLMAFSVSVASISGAVPTILPVDGLVTYNKYT